MAILSNYWKLTYKEQEKIKKKVIKETVGEGTTLIIKPTSITISNQNGIPVEQINELLRRAA